MVITTKKAHPKMRLLKLLIQNSSLFALTEDHQRQQGTRTAESQGRWLGNGDDLKPEKFVIRTEKVN